MGVIIMPNFPSIASPVYLLLEHYNLLCLNPNGTLNVFPYKRCPWSVVGTAAGGGEHTRSLNLEYSSIATKTNWYSCSCHYDFTMYGVWQMGQHKVQLSSKLVEAEAQGC